MTYPKGSQKSKDYSRDHYIKYKEKYIERNRIHRAIVKEWFDEYRVNLVCTRCGYEFSEYPEVCDFHHINPTEKNKTVSACKSIERMIEEIKECIPLCANCHRIEHIQISGE